MLPIRHSATKRCLNRYSGTFLVSGIILTFGGLIFLSLCNMPCEDRIIGIKGLADSRSQNLQQPLLPPLPKFHAYLVILVFSSPENRHQRDTIRFTWLSEMTDNVLTRFIVGIQNLSEEFIVKLNEEQVLHQDLLLLSNFSESYRNLTYKLMLGFHWVDEHVNCTFLLKIDDDSFVRLNFLVKELQKKPQERLYWGFFNGRAHVKKVGKWTEKDWFLCDRYLPYALGGGYIVTSDLVHYVSANSRYLKTYNSEDVSLGVWLGSLNIHRIHDERFDTEFVSRGCQNNYLITHKQKAGDMQELHRNVQTLGHLCSKEFMKRESYTYNWNVLPSKCCIRNDEFLQK